MTLCASDRPWLYLATDGKLFKIGISIAPDERVQYLTSPREFRGKLRRAELVKVWYMRGYAHIVERAVKEHFIGRRIGDWCTEWFGKTTEAEIVKFVKRFAVAHLRMHPQST